MANTCETCRWYDNFTGACCNDRSPHCADFTVSTYACAFWEENANDIKDGNQKLKAEHEQATKLKWVRDPVAYSLYRVWKSADSENFRKEERRIIQILGGVIENGESTKIALAKVRYFRSKI